MSKKMMKVKTKGYNQSPYVIGLSYEGDLTPETKIRFIMNIEMDLINGGRIHSLAALFVDLFGISVNDIPEACKTNTETICNKIALDGMTPYDIIWMSVKVREFCEQLEPNRYPSVYKAEVQIVEKDYLQFLKDAR